MAVTPDVFPAIVATIGYVYENEGFLNYFNSETHM